MPPQWLVDWPIYFYSFHLYLLFLSLRVEWSRIPIKSIALCTSIAKYLVQILSQSWKARTSLSKKKRKKKGESRTIEKGQSHNSCATNSTMIYTVAGGAQRTPRYDGARPATRRKREKGGEKRRAREENWYIALVASIEINSEDPVCLRTHRSIDHAIMPNGMLTIGTCNPVGALSWLLK